MTINSSTYGKPIIINMQQPKMAILKRCDNWIEPTHAETIIYYENTYKLPGDCFSYINNSAAAFDIPYVVRCGETNKVLFRIYRNCLMGQDEWDKRIDIQKEIDKVKRRGYNKVLDDIQKIDKHNNDVTIISVQK